MQPPGASKTVPAPGVAGQSAYSLAVGSCITAVGGRVLTVNRYGPDGGAASVARLLVKAKGLAQKITSRGTP